MDSLATENQTIIDSPLFELFVKQYKSDLMKEGNRLFHVPSLLSNFCKMIMLHDNEKSIKCVSIPKETIFVDNVDDDLEYLENTIEKKTSGHFNQLDEITKAAMRKPTFQSAIIAFFYLDGGWRSIPYGPRIFFNGNGMITKNVEYMVFDYIRVVVADGKLNATVDYVAGHDKRIQDVVRFTMPVGADYEEGIFENSMLIFPKVDLQDTRGEMDDTGATVIRFRYKHDENGFNRIGKIEKESCEYNDSCGYWPHKEFLLNRPFEINVFYKSERVLRVKVDNLSSNE